MYCCIRKKSGLHVVEISPHAKVSVIQHTIELYFTASLSSRKAMLNLLWGFCVTSWSTQHWSVDIWESSNDGVDEFRTPLLQEVFTTRIPFCVFDPGIIILSPVLQTSVAVEALHSISNFCNWFV